MSILLSEVRIPDNGHSVIKVPSEEACYHLYHSGVVDNTGRHGVAIALSETEQAALLAWVPILSRLARARLKGTTVNFTVTAVYAPTLDTTGGRRTHFMMTFRTQPTEFPQETC